MKDFDKIFDRGKRREGDFKKRRDFGGGGGFRDREKPRMYEAICDECGKKCELPFKPTSNKPVYCSQCYSDREGGDRGERRSSDRRDSRGRDSRGRDSRGRDNDRPRFEEKRMFSATCDKCGKKFELPFKPTGERAVYCNECFKGDGNNIVKESPNQYKDQIESLGRKLDKIIELLNPKVIEAKPIKVKPIDDKLVEKKPKVKAKPIDDKLVEKKTKVKAKPKKAIGVKKEKEAKEVKKKVTAKKKK